jgi:hypothetical protein
LVRNPESHRSVEVLISTHAELRLGGDYLLRVELSKEEIAQLFYETHRNDIVRMFRSFVEDEQRTPASRILHERRARLEGKSGEI